MSDDPWSQWKAFAGQLQPDAQRSTFAPFGESAESFAAAARNYLDAAARAPATATAADEAARVFGRYLREHSMEFLQPPWSAHAGADGVPWAAMQNAPALGLTREHQQRWQRTVDAARRVADAQRRLQCLWSDTLRDAANAFAARVATAGNAAPMGGPPSAATLRGLYDSWIDCAEEAYAGTAHSDSFCDALADFVNASSQWRREFAASVEHWSKLLDLPTRSELNSLTLRLKHAEEQLRDARRPAAPRGAAATLHPAARAPRARRAKSKPKS